LFSRIASRLHAETNPLYRIRAQIESRGERILDLVSGNPNQHGIFFPQELLEASLIRGARQARCYHPDSLGQRPARESISSYYRNQGLAIPPENILLTPGTSISYWYCFKLLADEGEEILCPRPSYPLFDYIAEMSGVRMVSYPMEETSAWAIDLERLEATISTRTRAVIVISPHNPTGHVASLDEIDGVADIARRHDLAIISDEVFSEFLLGSQGLPRAAARAAPLVFTLNGFSKMFALPGLKLGWMTVSGRPDRVKDAIRSLELISDTFLPVTEMVQAAVPAIFEEGRTFLGFYAREIARRWMEARQILARCAHIAFVEPGGGFYVTLKLQSIDEEQAAQAILAADYLLVHPGYFYDIKPDHLVLSFIQEPEVIRTSFHRLIATLEHTGGSL
jgi:aspartate/methionine/tyrosine aminotransferase